MRNDRIRKKGNAVKVHFTGRGWDNINILSDFAGERKENAKQKNAANSKVQQ